MIRNLKVLLAAAMALAAFGAFGASGAQAAEFHCSVSPCKYTAKPDGTAKNSHHVFIVKNGAGEEVSFTCAEIKGDGETAGTTATTVTLQNIEYPAAGCTVNGSPGVTVTMNGCKYQFTNGGAVSITGCNSGKKIEVKIPTGCNFTIGEQGPLTNVTYTTIGTTPNREVTVSPAVTNIVVTADGNKAECLLNPTNPLNGNYTTGNTIVTGETTGGVMADAWYA